MNTQQEAPHQQVYFIYTHNSSARCHINIDSYIYTVYKYMIFLFPALFFKSVSLTLMPSGLDQRLFIFPLIFSDTCDLYSSLAVSTIINILNDLIIALPIDTVSGKELSIFS